MGCAPKALLRYKVCGCRLLQKPPRLKLAETYRLEPLQSDHRSQAASDLESDAMRFHPSARPWLGELGESRFSSLGLNPLLSGLKQPALSIFFFGFGKFLLRTRKRTLSTLVWNSITVKNRQQALTIC